MNDWMNSWDGRTLLTTETDNGRHVSVVGVDKHLNGVPFSLFLILIFILNFNKITTSYASVQKTVDALQKIVSVD